MAERFALVALGRWNPAGVAFAALLFGAANASQFMFQAMDVRIPYQFFLMLPYLLTIPGSGRRRGLTSQPHASWGVSLEGDVMGGKVLARHLSTWHIH